MVEVTLCPKSTNQESDQIENEPDEPSEKHRISE
jgi:hypothetical protein